MLDTNTGELKIPSTTDIKFETKQSVLWISSKIRRKNKLAYT